MKMTKLGQSGLDVTNICLGGNVFGWTVDEEKGFAILDAFRESGGNFIDTADVYSRWAPGNHGGESEKIIGAWMKSRGCRKEMVIATKFGMEMGPHKKGLSRDYMLSAVEASLARLQTDYIDLYIAHQDDEEVPTEETMEAFGMLIKHGKIRVPGASNYSGKRLTRAIQGSHRSTAPAYQSLQPQYNLYDRAHFERDQEAVCREFNLGVTPYYALASGFLTGKYRSAEDSKKSPRGGGVQKYLDGRGLKILAALDQVAKNQSVSLTQVALAWLISRPVVTAPIASATSVEQLREIMGAADVQLTNESLKILDQASDPDFAGV